jgi:hypothetical protein
VESVNINKTVAMNVGNTLQDGGIMTLCRVDSMADFDCTIRSEFLFD